MFFWVKCKMKYSRTSQGCTSAGFYGNCRAVFSAVVSLRLALCFQAGEEGRVRTVPKRGWAESGATSPINVKQNLSAWDGIMSWIPYFVLERVDADRRHIQSNSHSQGCNRRHSSVDINLCPFKTGSFRLCTVVNKWLKTNVVSMGSKNTLLLLLWLIQILTINNNE